MWLFLLYINILFTKSFIQQKYCETATATFHSVSLLKEKRSDEEDEDDDMQKLFKFLSFTLMIDIPERKVQVRVSF